MNKFRRFLAGMAIASHRNRNRIASHRFFQKIASTYRIDTHKKSHLLSHLKI